MADMMQWEYRVGISGSTMSTMKNEVLEALLNEWGEEGWEVIAVFLLEHSSKMRLVAKRPLSLTSRRRRSWPSE
jgi:hypothetical protein